MTTNGWVERAGLRCGWWWWWWWSCVRDGACCSLLLQLGLVTVFWRPIEKQNCTWWTENSCSPHKHRLIYILHVPAIKYMYIPIRKKWRRIFNLASHLHISYIVSSAVRVIVENYGLNIYTHATPPAIEKKKKRNCCAGVRKNISFAMCEYFVYFLLNWLLHTA